MALLPTIGTGVAGLGAMGFILGIASATTFSQPLVGAALIILGLGLLLTGVVLFLAICVLQDLLGIL